MVGLQRAADTGGMRDKTFIRALGLRVRTLRERQGYSQEELAHRSGVSSLTVSKIELGGVDARVGTLNRLARTLGISTGELLSDMDSGQPDREHRKAVNEIAASLTGHDLSTVKTVQRIVSGALSLKGVPRRRR